MKKKKLILVIFWVTGLVFVLNCAQATINSVVISKVKGGSTWEIDNPLLANDIEIRDVKQVITNGNLFINILLKNSWYHPISGKIKLEFFGTNGVQFDDPWGWHTLLLESHQEEWFKFIAPRKGNQITKIKVMVRGIGEYSMPER